MTTTRKRTLAKAGAATLLIAGIAGGGLTYALWDDRETVAGKIGTGQIGFGIGEVGNVNTFSNNGSSVTYSIGPDAAKTLLDDGKYAHVVQIDGASKGSTGLDFTTAVPNFSSDGGVFSQATTSTFFVTDPADCTADADPSNFTATSDAARELVKTGSASDNSIRTATQYLCIQAKIDKTPDGSYSNTGTVSGTDENGGTVTSDSTWSASVNHDFGDPTKEPKHTFTFDPAAKDGA